MSAAELRIPDEIFAERSKEPFPTPSWVPRGRFSALPARETRTPARSPQQPRLHLFTMLQQPLSQLDRLDAAIRALYTKLGAYAQAMQEDPAAAEKYRTTLAQLRELRRVEARTLLAHLDDKLDWTLEREDPAIRRANELIAAHANLAFQDRSPDDSDP